jgi:phage N-6-adenine-methyltransferase
VSAKLAALMSSEKQDWQTPESILALVRQLGPIGLDPATDEENVVKATRILTPDEDALAPETAWHVEPGEVCYLNPPFDGVAAWVERWTVEAANHPRSHFVMLTPARTDTRWWAALAVLSDAVCFTRGRLRFRGAPASAPFPTALTYRGPSRADFERVFSTIGWCIRC